MGVIRVEKNGNFTVMANHHLDDKGLSLKAKGLLSLMLRLPPDWNYTVRGLLEYCADGKAAVASALQELETAGYLVRDKQSHDEGGHFSNNNFTVYECPPKSPFAENQKTAPPFTDFPVTEKPVTENRTLLNTELLNTELPIPPKAPQRGRRVKEEPSHEPEMFARFWAAYPRHEDKQSAIREWDVLHPDRQMMFIMSAALSSQKASEDWKRGIGIPYACRWLKHRRWEDGAPVNAGATAPEPASSWADDPEVL